MLHGKCPPHVHHTFWREKCLTQNSDDSVVIVGVSENIKVQKHVHPKPETSPDITILPETPVFKKMKLLPNNGELSSIEETEGKYQNIYNNKIYIYIYTAKEHIVPNNYNILTLKRTIKNVRNIEMYVRNINIHPVRMEKITVCQKNLLSYTSGHKMHEMC